MTEKKNHLYIEIAFIKMRVCFDAPEIMDIVAFLLKEHIIEQPKLEQKLFTIYFYIHENISLVPAELVDLAHPIDPQIYKDYHPDNMSGIYYSKRAVFLFTGNTSLSCYILKYSEYDFNCKLNKTVRSDSDPERFYYRYLFFSIITSLWLNNILTLHAAAVCSKDFKKIFLFIGRSYSAKTSITLSFLNSKWNILTDDTVFFGLSPSVSEDNRIILKTIARSMHIHLELKDKYNCLLNYNQLEPYLAGKQKFNFNIKKECPNEFLTELAIPTAVFFPGIKPQEITEKKNISMEAGLAKIHDFILPQDDIMPNHHSIRMKLIKTLLSKSQILDLTCGKDMYARPEEYVNMINRLENNL